MPCNKRITFDKQTSSIFLNRLPFNINHFVVCILSQWMTSNSLTMNGSHSLHMCTIRQPPESFWPLLFFEKWQQINQSSFLQLIRDYASTLSPALSPTYQLQSVLTALIIFLEIQSYPLYLRKNYCTKHHYDKLQIKGSSYSIHHN